MGKFVSILVGVVGVCALSFMTQKRTFGDQCEELRDWVPSFTRLIAVGDVHGDSVALIEILMAAGVSDASCTWIGGIGTRLIQMGDIVDRGPDSEGATQCLQKLQNSTSTNTVIRLTGNHEIMWAEGDARFASKSERPALRKNAVDRWLKEVMSGAVRGAYSVGPFLFTHAGFRPTMLAHTGTSTGTELASLVNTELLNAVSICQASSTKRCKFDHELFSAGPDRGGRGIGGCFWTDFSVLAKASIYRLPPGIIQIVGHSAARCSTRRQSSCEPIRSRPDLAAIVVDAGISRAYNSNRAYLEIISEVPPSSNQMRSSGTQIITHVLDTNGLWQTRDLTAGACAHK